MQTEFNKAPKVSVVMTTLQSERFLHEAIDSILDQSWSNFELIIVDGGSQDATYQIVQEFDDNRIRFLRRDGLRRSAQLNAAISASKGELIAIMDSDDIALSTRLGEQTAFFDSHSDISIAGTWATLISENGEPIGDFRRPLHHQEIVRHLLAMNGICFGTTMFRRGVYESIGLFTESLTIAEDIDWFLRGIDSCRFANIPKVLMRLRQNSQSRSRFGPSQDRRLVECLTETLCTRLAQPQTRIENGARERDKGLVHYYYGDIRIARKHFSSSFSIAPFDLLTLRYLLPSVLIPHALFVRLRQSPIIKKASALFRKCTVWRDVKTNRSIT